MYTTFVEDLFLRLSWSYSIDQADSVAQAVLELAILLSSVFPLNLDLKIPRVFKVDQIRLCCCPLWCKVLPMCLFFPKSPMSVS